MQTPRQAGANNEIEINCNVYNQDTTVTIEEMLPPEITSYNSEVTAGTRTLLTINGNNFLPADLGNVEVWFTNANKQGILHTNNPDELMYWQPKKSIVTITNETEEASNYLISHSANHNCQNGAAAIKTNCTTSTFEIRKEQFISFNKIGNEIQIYNPNYLEINKIKLFTIDGRSIFEYQSNGQEIQRIEIDDNLPQGIYLISAFIGGEVFTYQFIITK